jgi:uncharacterized integral membrane protein (TIGR00698 family)
MAAGEQPLPVQAGVFAACALVLVPLILNGNPAVALLVGGAIALLLDRTPIQQAGFLGRCCLQTAIVLLGLKLQLDTVWALSASYGWGVAVFVLSTLGIGLWLGRLLKAGTVPTQLLSAGTAICGGTTIASLSPVIGAKAEDTAVTLSLVFLLNVVAMLLFPLVGHWLELSQVQFGLWSALAIHDTSSVVATATIFGDEASEVATTIKLGRTLWLIPLILGASLLAGRGDVRLRVPGFILMFLLATAAASFLPIPDPITHLAGVVSKALLVCALFCIGTGLTRSTVRQIQGRVLWHGLILWLIAAPLTLLAILRWV